jgi:hypothetical protein
MAPRESTTFDFSDAADLLRRLEPQLEELWRTFCLSPDEAYRVLGESLVTLGVGKRRVRDAEAWLLDTVRGRCEQVLQERLEAFDGDPQ